MRNLVAGRIVVLFAVLAFSSAVTAQAPPGQRQAPADIAPGVPAMPNPPGPAPKHDLTAPGSGRSRKSGRGSLPCDDACRRGEIQTQQASEPCERQTAQRVEATNDPFIMCDPLGLPRDLRSPTLNGRGGMRFEAAQDRMLILYELQRVWREIWMDGRQLPAKVDAAGYPDSRYYGYSVGHWEGDNVFVIDTTGLDPRTWLDEVGHPHSNAAKIQERYTRLDQYNLEVTVTVDDPQFYTQPYQLLKEHYYWKKNQDLEEVLCIPSEATEYQEKLANPSGWGPEGKPAQ